MPVGEGDRVRVEYEGFFDDGEVFDSTDAHGGDPLEFEVGAHQVVAGFENAVIGKELNEAFEIKLQPEEAYGEYHEEGVQRIPRDNFPPDISPEVGMMLQLQQKHEEHTHDIPAWITEVDDDEVTIDMNHPMAGKVLNFKMKIVGIN